MHMHVHCMYSTVPLDSMHSAYWSLSSARKTRSGMPFIWHIDRMKPPCLDLLINLAHQMKITYMPEPQLQTIFTPAQLVVGVGVRLHHSFESSLGWIHSIFLLNLNSAEQGMHAHVFVGEMIIQLTVKTNQTPTTNTDQSEFYMIMF